MKLEFEYLPVNSLKPYEKNARKHTDFDVGIIKKSIEQFGFNDPIGIWGKDNIIIEGHGRLLAAKELGMTEVPVIRLDHLTNEERKMYALEHNRSAELSTWDMDTLMSELDDLKGFDLEGLGFTEFMLGEEDDGVDDLHEDDFEPIVPDEPFSKSGDLYILGDHKLLCGDATNDDDVNRLLGADDIDLYYTDPPYNVDVHNSEGKTIANDNLEEGTFVEILRNAFRNAAQHMKPGASFYVWHGDFGRVNFQLSLEEFNLVVKQCLIWVKNSFNFGRQDYKWQHEPCLFGWIEGGAHYFVPEFNHPTVIEDKLDLDKLSKAELKDLCKQFLDAGIPSTVFRENKPRKNDLHPTMKPVVMCGQMIHNSSRKNDVVYDSFGGSGSTMIACQQLKRKCRMMELEEEYVDVIVKRFVKSFGKDVDCYLIRDGQRMDIPSNFYC